MPSILAPYRTRRHVRTGNDGVVASSRVMGFGGLVVAATALVGVAAGFTSHRDAEVLDASLTRLEQARAECQEAQAQMQKAYAWAEGRTAGSESESSEGSFESLHSVMVSADEATETCDASATSDPESNDLLTARFKDAADSASDLQAVLVSARVDIEQADADAALLAAVEDFDVALATLQEALADGRAALEATADRVAEEEAWASLQSLLGEGSTAAAAEVPNDVDAAWYASRAQALNVSTAQITAATAGVDTSHEAWLSEAAAESLTIDSLAVEVHHEDSETAFCEGLDEARASGGLPSFATCSASVTLVAHAEDMAIEGDIWHSGQDNIVGYASTVPRLVDVFMASQAHHDLIMTPGDSIDATVGCAWRHVTGTNAAGAKVDNDLVFCTAAFAS